LGESVAGATAFPDDPPLGYATGMRDLAALAARLHGKRSNKSVFEQHRADLAAQLAERYRDGDDITDLVGAVWDVLDPLVPAVLRDAIVENDTEAYHVRYHSSVLERESLVSFLGFDDPALFRGLGKPGALGRIPCFVISNTAITLHFVAVNPMRFVEGGDA
jgi:hypothetical protein